MSLAQIVQRSTSWDPVHGIYLLHVHISMDCAFNGRIISHLPHSWAVILPKQPLPIQHHSTVIFQPKTSLLFVGPSCLHRLKFSVKLLSVGARAALMQVRRSQALCTKDRRLGLISVSNPWTDQGILLPKHLETTLVVGV